VTAAFLLLLQAAIGTPPERIDLLRPAATTGCKGPAGEEIVVCGARGDPYRIRPLESGAPSTLIPKAEVKLFGGKAATALEAEAAAMPNGAISNRLMARIKQPF